ncbi:MAG: alpha/beta hydrolase [Pseudomonadota bacterium]
MHRSVIAAAALATAAAGGAAEAASLRPAACWAAPPPEATDARYECATYLTAETPGRVDSREIAIPLLLMRGSANGPPTVFIEGGPGVSVFPEDLSPAVLGERLYAIGGPFLAFGPVLFFEQRGVGRALPSLNCRELDVFAANAAGVAASDEVQQLEFRAARRCRDRLIDAGADLDAYATPFIADDVADIVRAYGFRQANLFGVSYGTRVALETMRRHPARVRAAVLDGVYPLDVNFIDEKAAAARAALARFVATCARSAICRQRFPALGAQLDQALARVVANPPTTPASRADADPVAMNAVATIEALANAMDHPDDARRLPSLIEEAAAGRFRALADYAPRPFFGGPDLSEGVALAVECRETFAYAAQDRAHAGGRTNDPFALYAARERLLDLCAAWWARPGDPSERVAVRSDVPTLILAGAFDAATPLEWAQRARRRLSDAQVLVFGDRGHVTTDADDCATAAAAAFLVDPGGFVPPSCVAEKTAPEF